MNFTRLKFSSQLLLTLLFVLIPLILLSSLFAYHQVKKNLQTNIEKQLQDSTDSLVNLITTSVSVSIKNRLHGIAQKNLEIAQYYYQRYTSGDLTKEQAIKNIEEVFLSQSVGASGYIYCLNSQGIVLMHPNKQIQGSNISNMDFARQQVQIKQGYLEYNWVIPGEIYEHRKALYMAYFEPLDWIISVSSYRDEFTHLTDLNDLKAAIFSFKSGKTGYAYIVDDSGNVVIHPKYSEGNLLGQSDNPTHFLKQMIEKKSGKIKYHWKNLNESKAREKIVIYKYLPEFKWIVASSSYVTEVYAPLKMVRNFLIGALIIIIFSLVGVVFLISAFVTKPLGKMMNRLGEGAKGDYGVRMDEQGPMEFVILSQHFNSFMHQLEENNKKIEFEIKKNIESQTALVENDLKLRSLFDQSFQYMGILSPFGTLEQINQSVLDFAGGTAQDALYQPFWEAKWWRHDQAVQDKLKQSIKKAMKGEFVRYEITAVSKEEKVRDIDISIKPVFLPSGEIAFIITEGRDITNLKRAALERKNLAVQLERSQKMEAIGTLAGGIAHDFNNILSGILGYAQLAQISMDQPAKAKSHVKQISKGIQRAAELTQQILTFSRQTEYEKQSIKLHLVVKEALKLMRSSIPATIEIKELIFSTGNIMADPTQMHQVIMNLCTNAYHAMNEFGGVLTVKIQKIDLTKNTDVFNRKINAGQYIELEVTDTGHGMDKETFSKAFDPYYTTKDVGKGTGFGLALVHAIVDEHDGYINAKSTIGKGSSFYVYLPVVKRQTNAEISPKPVKLLKGGSEKIMVVDDEVDIRNILQEFLNGLGYSVSVFEDGAQAFAAFEADIHAFDLIVTDMTMPKMTGDEFAKQVLKQRKDIPIILCTGYSETVSEAQIIEMGIKKYIQKPVDNLDLSVFIRTLLDEQKAR